MNNSFWIPLLVSFGTMIFLYFLGFLANIDLLLFKLSLSYTEISLLPIFVGMIMGFISERMIKWRARAS
ncbi:ATPase [Sporosarcina sp. P34]|uniref:ATPase n=1 Tax=Sporosarcina sp. P34 TaxID=2048247 RepID=UPI000C166D04|nr:ATPase [Sporosarcina sp. P34]PID16984.1 ATPase [Sporosarcina sp. P34]